MDDLLQKYNDYIRLKNCRAEYLLSNGMIICIQDMRVCGATRQVRHDISAL